MVHNKMTTDTKMTTAFPLPKATQESYSKWYSHTVSSSNNLNKYTILWVGQELPCRFKSDSISDIIGPHHVFILKKNSNFAYAVIDNNETIYRLPKKFYTSCFPGVQYNSIPPNNRVKMKITNGTVVELPFIPNSFLQQKQNKTTRSKRKRSASIDESVTSSVENIDFSTSPLTWTVLQNQQISTSPIKQEIMMLIRNVIEFTDNNDSFILKDPFELIGSIEEIKSNEQLMCKLKTVISFIYHFCRAELGCFTRQDTKTSRILQSWIGELNETETK